MCNLSNASSNLTWRVKTNGATLCGMRCLHFVRFVCTVTRLLSYSFGFGCSRSLSVSLVLFLLLHVSRSLALLCAPLHDVTHLQCATSPSSGTFNAKSLKSIIHVVDLDAQSRNNCYRILYVHYIFLFSPSPPPPLSSSCSCSLSHSLCFIKLFVAEECESYILINFWQEDLFYGFGVHTFWKLFQKLVMIWKIATWPELHKSSGRILVCTILFFAKSCALPNETFS